MADVVSGLPPGLSGALAGLGFGGVTGAVVGYTVKKAAKLVALVLGAGFILLQLLAYWGYVHVDWSAIQGGAEAAWHTDDGRTIAEQGWEILRANLPFGGGFAAGFAIGFKLG